LDRSLPRRSDANSHIGIVDRSRGSEHAARAPDLGATLTTLYLNFEKEAQAALGLAIRCPLVCPAAYRLPDGPVPASAPYSARRCLQTSVGSDFLRSVATDSGLYHTTPSTAPSDHFGRSRDIILASIEICAASEDVAETPPLDSFVQAHLRASIHLGTGSQLHRRSRSNQTKPFRSPLAKQPFSAVAQRLAERVEVLRW
jgi:hypothetical protein